MEDNWVRYQFNNAIALFGRYVQNQLDQQNDQGEYINSLDDVFSRIGNNASPPQQMSAQLVFSNREVMDF